MEQTIIGILIAGLAMFFGIFASKEAYHANKEKKEAQKEAEKAVANAEKLSEYTGKVQKESKTKEQKIEEVNNAKTKEELRSHARDTANSNNDRVRKQAESKNGSTTKTRKTSSKSTTK